MGPWLLGVKRGILFRPERTLFQKPRVRASWRKEGLSAVSGKDSYVNWHEVWLMGTEPFPLKHGCPEADNKPEVLLKN